MNALVQPQQYNVLDPKKVHKQSLNNTRNKK